MKKHSAFKLSLISVIIGIAIGLVVVAITGRSPLNLIFAILRSMTGFNFSNMSQPWNLTYVLNWLLESLPIILTGLSVGFAYRTGLFNIGAEGQFMVGATATAFAALAFDLPAAIHIPVCVLSGMAAGALWALLPGILKAYRNINEVVICIMLNYTGMYFSNMLVRNFLPIDINTNARTIAFPDSAVFSKVITGNPSNLHWGILVVILAVIAYWFIIEKTTFGFGIRATGFNKEAARFAGMKVERNIVASMAISGAFAGAAGSIIVMGIFKYGRIFTQFDNYGFDGISVALVGAASGPGIILAGLLFGLLKAANTTLQLFNIPKEISELIQATIIYIVAIQYAIIIFLDKVKKKKKVPEVTETIKTEGETK